MQDSSDFKILEIEHVILQDAAIHHDFQPGRAGTGSRFFMHNSQLHPDDARIAAYGSFDNIGHVFWPAEDVDNLEWFPNVVQRRISLFPENLRLEWIYRDNPVTRVLHILRHRVTCPPFV